MSTKEWSSTMTEQNVANVVHVLADNVVAYRKRLVDGHIAGPMADEMVLEFNRQAIASVVQKIGMSIQSAPVKVVEQHANCCCDLDAFTQALADAASRATASLAKVP